jgi:hypothetical protein
MNLSCMSVWSLCSLFIYSYFSLIGLTDMTSYINMVFVSLLSDGFSEQIIHTSVLKLMSATCCQLIGIKHYIRSHWSFAFVQLWFLGKLLVLV